MATPSFVSASTGVIITTGSSAVTKTVTVGNLVILHALWDGSGTRPATSAVSNVASIGGTANSIDLLTGSQTIGVSAAGQATWCGRATGTALTTTLAVNAGGDDIYARWYEFAEELSSATTVATLFENAATTPTVWSGGVTGVSTTVADDGVVCNGNNRLALNFVGINDDATGLAAFTGETGGDWTMPAIFESSTGTDATIALMTAVMDTGGTINGGTATITSDSWGSHGVAIIGEEVTPPAFIQLREVFPWMQAVNRSNVY